MKFSHTHNWQVVGTELDRICLMVECSECKDFGIVRNPTKEEWGDAFYAPSSPYKWTEADRVMPLSHMHGEMVAQDEVFSLN